MENSGKSRLPIKQDKRTPWAFSKFLAGGWAHILSLERGADIPEPLPFCKYQHLGLRIGGMEKEMFGVSKQFAYDECY